MRNLDGSGALNTLVSPFVSPDKSAMALLRCCGKRKLGKAT